MPRVEKRDSDPKRIAYFVSPHGFGHAARAAAVMQSLSDMDPSVHFEIFTTVPHWFFQESLTASFSYHYLLTDIGLEQKTAFEIDYEDSLRRLSAFFPVPPSMIAEICETIEIQKCVLVVCEIAPMGILVAKKAGIASLLVENFTWDWIYEHYSISDERIHQFIDYLKPIFDGADFHIQTEPVCRPASVDLLSAPVSRKVRTDSDKIRAELGISRLSKMVLITTGGIPQSYDFLEKLHAQREICFVMPGAGPEQSVRNNLTILPHHSAFYHPDLVNASDAVVGKIGYSTVAEVYQARIPFGYVARSDFRESVSMVDFVQKRMSGIAISESDFSSGNWIQKLNDLFGLNHMPSDNINGADQIGRFIARIIA